MGLPFAVRVSQAARGQELFTSWSVPAGWPAVVDSLGSDSRDVHLLVRKASRRGTTVVVWRLMDNEGGRLDGGRASFAAMRTQLSLVWRLAI